MSDLVLSKESSNNELMNYFNKIHALVKVSETEFIVDLDDVWPLVYGRKEEAVRALISSDIFIKGVDYQVLRTLAKNPKGGRPSMAYLLTVPCLEYFIVKKVRPVFEVYREVFHKTVEAVGAAGQVDPSQLPGLDEALMTIMEKFPNIPKTYGDALIEAGRLFNEKESLKNKIVETTIRANMAEAISNNLQNILSSNEYKITFYDNVLKNDDGLISMDETAKKLSAFGISITYKSFLEFMCEIKFIIRSKAGRLTLSSDAIRKEYATYRIVESYVFGKKLPCNIMMITNRGLVKIVGAIKGKLNPVFLKYGSFVDDEEDNSPY